MDQLTGTGLVASRAFLAIITQFLATFAAIFTSVLAILAPAFTPVSAVFAPLFTAFHAGRLGLGIRSAKCRGGQQRDRQPENRESVTARDHVGIDRFTHVRPLLSPFLPARYAISPALGDHR